MNIQRRPIDSLTPDPENARTHDADNLAAIAASLKAFGQQKPIVVDTRGVVLAGNGTLAAARSLGWTEVAVVETDLEGAAAAAYAIADNRTGELSQWDYQALALALEQLPAGMALATGFESGAVESITTLAQRIESEAASKKPKIITCPQCGAEIKENTDDAGND
jgi:ParB-like chromosome segregation protein Spo0J